MIAVRFHFVQGFHNGRSVGKILNGFEQRYNVQREFIFVANDQVRELMENTPMNRDSVKLRERIVLPLITIQQFALQHLRTMEKSEEQYEKQYRKLVLRCMFGIINAARNSA